MDSDSTNSLMFWRGVGLGVFLAIAAFFLLTEHRAHLYGAIPYLLALGCLMMAFLILRLDRNLQRVTKPRGVTGAASDKKENTHE